MGTPMDYSEIVHAPNHRSQVAILEAYLKSERVAIAVVDWIRARGWQATAHGGPAGGPLVVIPPRMPLRRGWGSSASTAR